jgi:hypothetical protein
LEQPEQPTLFTFTPTKVVGTAPGGVPGVLSCDQEGAARIKNNESESRRLRHGAQVGRTNVERDGKGLKFSLEYMMVSLMLFEARNWPVCATWAAQTLRARSEDGFQRELAARPCEKYRGGPEVFSDVTCR